MTIIAQLGLPADAFELGRVLAVEGGTSVELEHVVTLAGRAVPLVTVHDGVRAAFESAVSDQPAVADLQPVSRNGDRTLYALDLDGPHPFFRALSESDAHLLHATGSADGWDLALRVPDHPALVALQEQCAAAGVDVDPVCLYNPTAPDSGAWYGLTETQRNTLIEAVEAGYYSIPRRTSTQDLADAFGVSDQAITERLRRAIATFVENALIAAAAGEPEPTG